MKTHCEGEILSRLTDWHAFSLNLAGDLAQAGHLEAARIVESGASEALMKLLFGTKLEEKPAPSREGTG